MRFAWNRATAGDSSSEPSAPTQAQPDGLAAIQLLMADGPARVGWIDTRGQRTSDWLNAQDLVPIRGLAAGDDAGIEPPDPEARVQEVEREAIVWVVPPDLPANRHLRLHRRRVLVHLELDEYDVSGQAHVRPGADAVDQVLRGPRDLVPLTEVQVVSRASPDDGMALPVLIVNRSHVRRIAEDASRATGAVPDPVGTGSSEVDPRIALLPPDPAAAPTDGSGATTASDLAPPTEMSGVEMLNAALLLLLDTGVIDVVEFQSIRARIPELSTG